MSRWNSWDRGILTSLERRTPQGGVLYFLFFVVLALCWR